MTFEFLGKPKFIGMLHLPPLMGYSGFLGISETIEYALEELDTLQEGGVDAILVENEYDHPHQVTVEPEIIACFTRVFVEIVRHAKCPIGLQVLLNDWKASLAIAQSSGGLFTRLDFFVDDVVLRNGVEIHPSPDSILEYRNKIGASHVKLFTDVHVKYSQLIHPKSISESTRQAIAKSANAIVITGRESGMPPVLKDILEAKSVAQIIPLLIGSGISAENISEFLPYANGYIVGTSIKTNGRIDKEKVKRLSSAISSV